MRDNYSRFYLKYIEPVKDIIDVGSYAFSSLDQLKGLDAVLGLAFENLIVISLSGNSAAAWSLKDID